MLAKLTSRNRLTLPKAALAAVETTDYFDVTTEDGRIILTPVRVNRADGVRVKLAKHGLSVSDVKNAVAWGAVRRLTPVRPVLGTSVQVSSLLFHAAQVHSTDPACSLQCPGYSSTATRVSWLPP